MSSTPSPNSRPEWISSAAAGGLPKFSDHDAAYELLDALDYDAQLYAIRTLLQRHREADQQLVDEIKRLEVRANELHGEANEYAVAFLIDHYHGSVYQDAAHSMAAVGMLAPFVESIFYHAFQGIRQQTQSGLGAISSHDRWQQPTEDQWDCHFVWKRGKRSGNLVEGILQLSEATGLHTYLPATLRHTLQALFEYRNKMFHCGFEWPVHERAGFQRRIAESGWPTDWFATATHGGKPWVFYMASVFIEHCLESIEGVITGIGAFCKTEMPRLRENVEPTQ